MISSQFYLFYRPFPRLYRYCPEKMTDYYKTRNELRRNATRDLNIGHPFVKDSVWPIKNCWHFSSDGNYAEVLFYDYTDFRDAMNRIAVLCLRFPVLVLTFCLMDNHFHFVLYGSYESCNLFVHEFMRLTGWSLSLRYGKTDPVRDIPIDCSPIDNETYLCRAVCYDILNPTAAGLDWMYYDYPWSSGPLLMRRKGCWLGSDWKPCGSSQLLSHIKIKDRQRLLKTKEEFPEGWWLTEGIIFPGLYVETDLVQSVFRSCRSFSYFISHNKKDDIDSEKAMISRIGISDSEMRTHRDEILLRDWGGANIRSLDVEGRLKIGLELKREYGISAKAVARIVRLPLTDIEKFLSV